MQSRRIFFFYFPVLFLFFCFLYVFSIYVQWSAKRDDILSQLKEYKRFIDYTEDLQDGVQFGGYLSAGVQNTAIGIPSKILDRNNRVIGEFYSEKREVIPLKKIPKSVVFAVIANEDADFMDHRGINPRGIIRAFFVNLFNMGYLQGGSTLTQQLAKGLFTEGRKTIKRKVFEAFCALKIEEMYDKQDILSMYLNLIYFGKGAYGIEEAARTYFNKSAQELSLGEAAMLVGLIPNPTRFNPIHNIHTSMLKTKSVLQRLIEEKKISPNTGQEAITHLAEQWQITIDHEMPNGGESKIGKFSAKQFLVNRAPHFNEMLRRILIKIFDEESLKQNGLKIYTTLDLDKQIAAEELLKMTIEKQRNYHLQRAEKFLEKNLQTEAETEKSNANNINGALVSINPVSGHIEAYVAGYEFSADNQLDRVSQIYRQPGSSFKPFVYLAAIAEKKITQATMLNDHEIKLNGYEPKNYDNRYRGLVTAREALRRSINTVAVQVLHLTGYKTLSQFIRDGLDLTKKEQAKRFPEVLSLSLGSGEISPLEHVRLHSVIANGGQYIIPYGLRYVEDYGGKVIHDNETDILNKLAIKNNQGTIQLISPQAAYIVTRMLMGFFEPGVYGHRWKQDYNINFPIGGKTGTTSNYVDVWFTGYTPNLVTSIWMGNDKGNISLGSGHSGGGLLAPVWIRYTSDIRQFLDTKAQFPLPRDGLIFENYCASSGLVPRSADSCSVIANQPFIAGTEPGEYHSQDLIYSGENDQ